MAHPAFKRPRIPAASAPFVMPRGGTLARSSCPFENPGSREPAHEPSMGRHWQARRGPSGRRPGRGSDSAPGRVRVGCASGRDSQTATVTRSTRCQPPSPASAIGLRRPEPAQVASRRRRPNSKAVPGPWEPHRRQPRWLPPRYRQLESNLPRISPHIWWAGSDCTWRRFLRLGCRGARMQRGNKTVPASRCAGFDRLTDPCPGT